MDVDGKPFFQSATADNLSSEGAQLCHINHSLTIGDVIGIQHGDKKARFEVIWLKPALVPGRNNVGVMILPKQTVPWSEVTEGNRPEGAKERRGPEKRKLTRHKVQFLIALHLSPSRPP